MEKQGFKETEAEYSKARSDLMGLNLMGVGSLNKGVKYFNSWEFKFADRKSDVLCGHFLLLL